MFDPEEKKITDISFNQRIVPIDITPLRETGDELRKAINNAVYDMTSTVFNPNNVPNQIIMTQEQYDDLNPDMDVLYESNDRIYVTPTNAMEVVVKKPTITRSDVFKKDKK